MQKSIQSATITLRLDVICESPYEFKGIVKYCGNDLMEVVTDIPYEEPIWLCIGKFISSLPSTVHVTAIAVEKINK